MQKILPDNGSEFKSKLFSEVASQLGLKTYCLHLKDLKQRRNFIFS